MVKWTEFLRSSNGGLELNRLVGAVGGFTYIAAANLFVGYETFVLEKAFDITAYCLAFPAGLAAIVGGTAGAIALKDRNVASAGVIAATGKVPSKHTATDAEPLPVEVKNTPEDPANVTDSGDDELPEYARCAR